MYYPVTWGTRWHSSLRHCATSRKVAGSIPDGVNFHGHNPSGRTLALGSTHPLTEMSTRNISWGVKAAGAYGWQPYHFLVLPVLKSESLDLLEPSGPVQACNGILLPLPFTLLNTAGVAQCDSDCETLRRAGWQSDRGSIPVKSRVIFLFYSLWDPRSLLISRHRGKAARA